MPTLTLDKVWLNLLSTGDAVSGNSRDRAPVYENTGDVKQLSGGRLRAATMVGEAGSVSFTLLGVSEATLTTLREWKGETVQYRDSWGRLFNGVFLTVAPQELVTDAYGLLNKLSNVAITMRFVTAPAGV
jgi:hypothetical protein